MPDQKLKKVLIITYYWPPAGGPGVQRWLKFVKYLPHYNIKPTVYIPENPSYPIEDKTLLKEIPNGLTVLKHPISEPYKLANLFSKTQSKTISKGIIQRPKKQSVIERLLLFVRGNFFIPDARKAWVKPSILYLKEYLEHSGMETIITTGPPHSMHLIGMALKEQLGMRWIADFRDPWTTIGYHKQLKLTKSSKEKHALLESQVLNNADQIIVTSQHTKLEFKLKTKKPIEVITNGYDTHDVQRPEKASEFVVSHIGSLLSDRNPIILWQVLSELIEENESFGNSFRLRLAGIISEEVVASLNRFNLNKYTEYLGYVGHDEAIRQQMLSRVLLLIEINSEDTRAIIPGKIFEYMQSGTPILGLGPKGSEIEVMLKETNSGTYFDYEDGIQLKDQILFYFDAYKKGIHSTQPIDIAQYSRQAVTKKLAALV